MTNTNTTTKVIPMQNNTDAPTSSFLRMLRVLGKLADLGLEAYLKEDDGCNYVYGTFYDTGLAFCVYLPVDALATEEYKWAMDLDDVADKDTVEYIFTNLILNVLVAVEEDIEIENEQE